MRYVLINDYEIDKLGVELDYLKYKYESASTFNKSYHYEQYEKAKKKFYDLYNSKYPKTLIKPKPFKEQIRMSDWSEQFEEYEN